MIKVKLYGRLGSTFGKEWDIDVKTPKEVIKALDANTKGDFTRYLHSTIREKKVGYSFIVDGYKIREKEDIVLINHKLKKDSVIKVMPIIGGSGITTMIILTIISVGLQVASMLMAPSPIVDYGNSDDQSARKESYLFSGQNATARQGQAMPVGYGRMLVPPMLLSLQYVYKQTAGNLTASTGGSNPRFVNRIGLFGNVYQVVMSKRYAQDETSG